MAVIGNSSTQQSFTPAVDYFSGNASTTAFTLSRPVASVAQVQVVVNNVAQNPSSAYTISSNTITFTSAPSSGTNNIYVYYTSPITQVIAPGQGTVTATSMASSTGTGAGVFQTSPTITTPVISSLSSASSTALTLQSAGTTAVTIDTSQNVGIGTSTPAYKLDVAGTFIARGNCNFYQPTANTSLVFTYETTNGSSVRTTQTQLSTGGFVWNNDVGGNGSSDYFAWQSSSTERMRLDSGGNLQVGGQYAVPPTTSFGRIVSSGIFQSGRTGTGSQPAAEFFNGNSNVGSIYTSGSNTSYNTSSDYRLKQDIAPITGALTKVALLKPSTYKWKVDGANGEGFIAHELAEVFPQAVTGEKDEVDEDDKPKYQSIDTSFLVATLTAAIQELKAINDTQAETINALTARIEALENK